MSSRLTPLQAKAKVLAAKVPLQDAMPFVASFLQRFPVAVSSNPIVEPAYVRPIPECVLSHTAVEELELSELRVLMLHEALHILGGVFSRAKGKDWNRWTTAHDLAINLVINDEINRLNRVGLGGNDARTALLAWPRKYPPILDFRFVGMTAEEIYEVLGQDQAEGKPAYSDHGDCQLDGATPEQVAAGEAFLQRAALRAAEETSGAGLQDGALRDLVLKVLRPRLPWRRVLSSRLGAVLPRLEERSYMRPNPRDWEGGEGVLTPGTRLTGEAIMVAPDLSFSTVAQKLADQFLGEVDGACQAFDGPVRVTCWDTQVRKDVVFEGGGRPLPQILQGIKGGGNTNPACLLNHLLKPPVGQRDHPEPGFLIILTDGRVENWPAIEEWPCEVLVAYTHQAPPMEYASIHLDAAV